MGAGWRASPLTRVRSFRWVSSRSNRRRYNIRDIEAALHAADDARRTRDASRLLQRMLALGLSRYEPDAVAALEHSGRRQSV